METQAQARATANLAQSLDINARLPHQVFTRRYSVVYAFDPLLLIDRRAVELFKILIKQEGASVAVLGRFDRPKKESPDWRSDLFLISASTEAGDYMSFLTRYSAEYGHGSATPDMQEPWRIFAERIGACSDLGTWCVYGEKYMEIGLLVCDIGLTTQLEEKLYSEFRVERLANALKRDTFFGEPGNEYSKQQRAILRSAYLETLDEGRRNP